MKSVDDQRVRAYRHNFKQRLDVGSLAGYAHWVWWMNKSGRSVYMSCFRAIELKGFDDVWIIGLC